MELFEKNMHKCLFLVALSMFIGILTFATSSTALDKEKWKEEIEGKSFHEVSELKTPTQSPDIDLSFLSGLGPVLKVVLIVGLLLLVAFILYRLNYTTQSNKKINSPIAYTDLENLEQHIDEVDFHVLLKNAIDDKNYKLAIRIYFLIALKNLSVSNKIEWSNEKTNQEYLFEMYEDSNFQAFKKLIFEFEYAWYSDHGISEEKFKKIAPIYVEFITKTS